MKNLLALSLLSSSTILSACADKAGPDDDVPSADEIATQIEQENGGFDTADEAPMFGTAAQFAPTQIEADRAIDDTMSADPTIAAMEADPNVDARRVLVMWGLIPPDRDATDVRDWSGSLSLNRGGMRVSRAIAFEDAGDAVLPRTARESVEFTSRTRPHADGLALGILDLDPTNAEPLALTYANTAGDVALTVNLADLAAGPVRLDAGDGFSLVAVGARDGDRAGCEGGFMRGRWHQVDAQHGAFGGLVVNRRGEVVGHVRGLYGQRTTGEPVMFGKFIDRDGHFMGLLRGGYENGNYRARWITRDGDHGALGGRYFDGRVDGDGRGGFAGRWAQTGCAED